MINNNQNQQKFYDLFHTMMPKILRLKKAGHIVSFVTQCFALMQIFLLNLPIAYKIILYVVAFIISVFLSGIIEKGISDFFPYVTKQLLDWNFQNKWFRAMFFMLLVFVILPLFVASPILSAVGGNEIATNLLHADSRPSTIYLDSTYQKTEQDILNNVASEKSEANLQYQKKIAALEADYNAKITIEQNHIDKYQKVYNQGGKWAKENVLKGKNRIELYRSELAQKKATTLSELIQLTEKKDAEKALEMTRLHDLKQQEIEKITKDWETATKKTENKKILWGYILGFIAAFGVACTIVCIIIIGIYQKGAEGIIEESESNKSTNLLTSFFEDLSGKIADFLPTGKAESGSEKSGKAERRQIGFFSEKSGSKKAENFHLEITNEAESGIGKSGKKPEEIAAFSKKAEAKKAESKSGSTSQKFAAFQKKAEVVKAEVNEKKSGSFSNKKPVEKTRDSVIKTKAFLMNKNGKVTQHEVAEILSISERTVRKYWHD